MKNIFTRRLLFTFIGVLLITSAIKAQNIAITDDNGYSAESSAMLDVKSTSKGLLIPRMDSSQRVGISSPATGLLVFDTDANAFYYYSGADWLNLTTNVISPSSAGINDALFSVVNTNGDTVFAVYPEAVEISVGNGIGKANKGGFAVGGFSSGKAGESQYLLVSPDSVRVYVDTVSSKANKGGFAVGGFASGKGIVNNLLTVSDDSVRIYVTDPDAKAAKGGFAVGGFASGKTSATNFMKLTPKNYFIGHESGKLTTGLYNTFFGYQSGISNTTGQYNSFVGYQTGYGNTTGQSNVFLGFKSGYSNTGGTWPAGSKNVFLGYQSGYSNSTGHDNVLIGYGSGFTGVTANYNTFIGYLAGHDNTASEQVFIGYNAGANNTTGESNVIIGGQAGQQNTIGSDNVLIGTAAGVNQTTGNFNVMLGTYSGYSHDTGERNIFLGGWSGAFLGDGDDNITIGYLAGNGIGSGTTGSGNIFIGNNAGRGETDNSNTLFIENSSANSSSALIYGEFDNDVLRFNANVGISKAPSSYKLDVAGNVNLSSGYDFYKNGVKASTQWTTSGSNIYYTTGNVGLGYTAPGNHRLYATGSNTGTGGTTGYFKNTSASGLALMVENSSYSSSDNALLIVKRGSSGDIMRLDSYHGSSGGWDDEFRFTNDGVGYADGSWSGGGADFAEFFPNEIKIKNELEPGDLLLISDQGYAVEKEGEAYSKRIIGVYSENPALVGNADPNRDNTDFSLVGLVGVVPTKVSAKNGEIKVGDFITSSSIPGVGMRADKPCMVVGRALEPYNSNTVGKIKVLVSVQWSGYTE